MVPNNVATGFSEVPTRELVYTLVNRLRTDARFRLWVQLSTGVIAWVMVVRSYPLEDAVPRYADF